MLSRNIPNRLLILEQVNLCSTFQSTIFFKYLRKNIRVSSSLDPNQAQHFVGTGLGPNSLQKGINRIQKVPLGELVKDFHCYLDKLLYIVENR